MTEFELPLFVTKLYERAYSALDVINLIEDGLIYLKLEKNMIC
jgi:hypothetical protein